MSETSYPVSSKCCSKPLFGKVKFCPYCGCPLDPVAAHERMPEKDEAPRSAFTRDMAQGQKPQEGTPAPIIASPDDAHSSDELPENSSSVSQLKTSDPPGPSDSLPGSVEPPGGIQHSKGGHIHPARKTGGRNQKWIAAAVGIVVLVVLIFLYTGKEGPGENKNDIDRGDTGSSLPASACEAEKALALEALKEGVQLTIVMEMLPNQQSVLKAAKKLAAISERYQPQADTAERNIQRSLDKRDQAMKSYREKVGKLSRAKLENISCALDGIRESAADSREKMVAGLLASHVKDLRKGGKPDKGKWLSEFAGSAARSDGPGTSDSLRKGNADRVSAESSVPDTLRESKDRDYEAELDEADSLIDKKDYDQAYKLLSDVIDHSSNEKIRAQARFSRGLLLCEEMNKPDLALRDFETVIEENPNGSYTANAHYYTGWIYYQKKNNPKQAIPHLKTVVNKYPDSPMAQTAQYLVQDAEKKLNN